jgi:hypothetical protein
MKAAETDFKDLANVPKLFGLEITEIENRNTDDICSPFYLSFIHDFQLNCYVALL